MIALIDDKEPEEKTERDNSIRVEEKKFGNGSLFRKQHYFANSIHRTDGPAEETFFKNGAPFYRAWRCYGELHRTDGPAEESYYANGVMSYCAWYLQGYPHRSGGPAKEWFNESGKQVFAEYWLNGERLTRGKARRLIYDNRGMTLVELLVAMAVLALLLPGMLAFFAAGRHGVSQAGLQTIAASLAADIMEEQRRDLLTHTFVHGPGSRMDTPRPGFSRSVSWVERHIDAGGRQVSVWDIDAVVSYQDARGITQQTTLETFVFPR